MRNKFKSPITIILVLAMIMSIFASFPIAGSAATAEDDPTKYPLFSTTGGSVMVELEKAIIDPAYAKVEQAKEASGRKHVRFNPVNVTQPEIDESGAAGFEVKFDQNGKYNVWLRCVALDRGTNSVWLDFGAVQYRTGIMGYLGYSTDPTLSEHEADYIWIRMGTIQKNAGDIQKVRFINREPNFVVDKVIITNNPTYQPEGTGSMPDPYDSTAVLKFPEGLYTLPPVTPPPEHPRVFFRAQDIPRIKENMQLPEMLDIVKAFNTLKDEQYTGELEPKDPNYDARGLEIISAKALDYALYGNEENAKQALLAIKNFASMLDVASQGDNTRQEGHTIKTIAQVYDWCYPILTDKDKAELMLLAQQISFDMEVGFPPNKQGMLCGHGAEHQLYRDWLSMAIATYDEYPDAYNFVAGMIFGPDSVEYRNWWNQSGTHSQGSSYGMGRYESELYGHILIKNMCGYELFNEEDFLAIGYELLYRWRPDGMIMMDGDDNAPNAFVKKDTYLSGKSKDIFFLAASINGDPVLSRELFYQGGLTPTYSREDVLPTEMLVLYKQSTDPNGTMETLPLTKYNPSPVGEMIARTGWNKGTKSTDVVATMKIGEYYGMNHDNYDCGHFMIYYKGILANDSGWYEQHGSNHHRNYMAQSIAHNTLVIETEYNKWGGQNQGIDGQGVDNSDGKNFYWIPNDWEAYQKDEQVHFAEVIGHEFGPDLQYPEYTYIAGDIANSYTSKHDDGVNEALRHMLFLPTGNEQNPAAFIVFDKIDTKVGGKKKAFLLHSEEEPEVSGNVTTIKRTERDYNGKLVNQTLLPAANNLTIDKIGGAEFDEKGKVIEGTDKRFWYRDQNWPFIQDDPSITLNADTSGRVVNNQYSLESGWGRVEIMPTKSEKVDYMLNVMYVGSADDNLPVEKATLIETGSFAGAKIFDRVAMFNKNKARTKDEVTFNVPGNEQELKINVAGLKAGTWNVNANGNKIDTQISSEDGGMIYFTAPAGNITLTYASDDANKTFTQSPPPEREGVTLFYQGNFIFSDVPATIIDGRTLIPMRALLEAMKAEVTWDAETSTATADDGMTKIAITENSKTAYVNDAPVELDVPAMIINGRFVIPVRFIAESLGAKVVWNDPAKRVEITPSLTSLGQKDLGVDNYIRIAKMEQSGAEANPSRQIDASCDGDYSSYWGVSSADGAQAWGIYDLGRVKTLDKVMFSFIQGAARKYKFDIAVSIDGKSYKNVLVGAETSGTYQTGILEPFDLGGVQARYVKYTGYGNSVNMWNSLAEIVFTEKK